MTLRENLTELVNLARKKGAGEYLTDGMLRVRTQIKTEEDSTLWHIALDAIRAAISLNKAFKKLSEEAINETA